ncbi:polysaccharide deacetylase family protein [Streptomyces sp. DT24]|uniref:polysaccharide deacetylase family protein n=1 Tax=Streptomyces sp. DT24 TaxID=3416520 RepID=UPI003CEAAE2D
MQLVRQKDKFAMKRHRPGSRRRTGGGRRVPGTLRRRPALSVLAALLVAAAGSGCAAGAGSNGADGRAVEPPPARPGARAGQADPARALTAYAERMKRAQAARVAAARKWGLASTPLVAPAPPLEKPRITSRKGFEVEDDASLPPVFTTVPTTERIVFLTMDDGAEKDPELLRMMTELQIPYSAFLSDYEVNDNYGYFRDAQRRGVTINNHTLNHPYLPGLSYAAQKREICGQQDIIEKQFGKRPALLRPPYGNYNRATLTIAKSCGIRAVPLWAEEVFPDHMEYREWDRDLHPGDIILTHFRGRDEWKGSMPDLIRQVMKIVTAKGYAVAKLEDYV